MFAATSEIERHFRIGAAPVSLRTSLADVMTEYTALYDVWQCDRPNHSAIRVTVRKEAFRLGSRRRFDVRVNDRSIFKPSRPGEVLPYVEWGVTWELPAAMPQFLQLHACSMSHQGAGIIFPAQSGSGKSTLCTALLARNWKYLSDEFALVHADTLELHAYPRAICLKESSYAAVEAIGISLKGRREYLKGSKGSVILLPPTALGKHSIGSPCPLRHIIFPKYVAGAQPTLVPISRPEAVTQLHSVCFNLLKCRVLGLDVLTRMARQSQCYRLISSDLNQTCALIEQTLAENEQPRAKIA
jgi:hypothetical protein